MDMIPNERASAGRSATSGNGRPHRGGTASEERLLDVREAAQFLAVTVSTLYSWVWQRKISFIKLGRALRFDLAELRSFIDENRVHPRHAGRS